MSADVIDFYTRQRIPAPEPQTLEAQANAIFARVQPFGVDFSAAEPYHAPENGDCA
jgi:hypothetical protein